MRKFALVLLCFAASVIQSSAQSVTLTGLEQSMSSNIQKVCYKTTVDTTHCIYYSLPSKQVGSQPTPILIFIHGGAWVGGGANTFFGPMLYFNQRGIACCSIEYGLLNKPYNNMQQVIADCSMAVDYIKAQAKAWNIDTNKIILCGESAGGHLAACLSLGIATKPLSVASLLLFNPVVNLTTPLFIKFLSYDAIKQKKLLPDTTSFMQQHIAEAKQFSPLYHPKKLPPTYLVNGEDDVITPIVFAKLFADNLLQHNTPLTTRWLPKTGHAFFVPRYKSSEEVVVNELVAMDTFLIHQQLLKGNPTLVNGNDEHWNTKK